MSEENISRSRMIKEAGNIYVGVTGKDGVFEVKTSKEEAKWLAKQDEDQDQFFFRFDDDGDLVIGRSIEP